MWCRINFIGYYITTLLPSNTMHYYHTLHYKLNGEQSCDLIIRESRLKIPFTQLNINEFTTDRAFYLNNVGGLINIPDKVHLSKSYKSQPIKVTGEHTPGVVGDDSRPATPILDNDGFFGDELREADKNKKEHDELLKQVKDYDDDLTEIVTGQTDEDIITGEDDEGEGEGEGEDDDMVKSAGDMYSQVSEQNDGMSADAGMELGLTKYNVDDKVEILLSNELNIDNLQKMEIKNKNKAGTIKEDMGNNKYLVDFDGVEIELHANEMKKYDNSVKRINVNVRPKDMNGMKNALEGIVENEEQQQQPKMDLSSGEIEDILGKGSEEKKEK